MGRCFLLLLISLLLTACGRKAPPPLAEATIARDVAQMRDLVSAVRLQLSTAGDVLLVMPSPLPGRKGEVQRIDALRREAEAALEGSSLQLVLRHPDDRDLALHESEIYGGDFPVSLLENLLTAQENPPLAIVCYPGIPVGTPEELAQLASRFLLAGVARYGEVQANPLLQNGLLRVVAVPPEDGGEAGRILSLSGL